MSSERRLVDRAYYMRISQNDREFRDACLIRFVNQYHHCSSQFGHSQLTLSRNRSSSPVRLIISNWDNIVVDLKLGN